MLQEACHIKNTVVLIFRHFQCLHSTSSEVAWVLISSGTQVVPQIILNPSYLPDYLSISYDHVFLTMCKSTVRKVLSKNKIKKNTAPARRLASEYTSSCTKTLRLGIAFWHKWFLRLPKEKRIYLFFLSNIRSSYDINLLQNCGQTKP